ncbi:MAG: hypothetical protein A2W31_14235, partial [Planctomycetes bacterium RBG_16_64_10]
MDPIEGAPMARHLPILLAAVCGLLVPVAPAVADSADFMVKVLVDGKLLEGRPLSWSERRVFLLARDGQLVNFRPQEAQDYHRSSPRFYSYSTGEIRSQLYQEFGREFDVTGTGHYLVVHPRGQQDRWADRFERLYRSFYHYFQVRGFQLQEPKYPLVAIVFQNQDDYRRYASRSGSAPNANTLGHYDDWTNRISLFDVTAGKTTRDWSRNAETIIHEAAHQTAFNTGVHTRFGAVPRWLCEGLATMFEARGIWDWNTARTADDRINRSQLAAFMDYEARRWKTGSVTRLIASDDRFQHGQTDAYAEAWALSYYLCETQPRRYSQYLARTASHEPFAKVSAEQRLEDFKGS